MNKLHLTTQDILDKQFNVDFKGYSASEVDAFLDLILEDYYTVQENMEELSNQVEGLSQQLKAAKAQLTELQGKQRVIDLSNTTSYSSVDLLKRVSRLEEEVFNKR